MKLLIFKPSELLKSMKRCAKCGENPPMKGSKYCKGCVGPQKRRATETVPISHQASTGLGM